MNYADTSILTVRTRRLARRQAFLLVTVIALIASCSMISTQIAIKSLRRAENAMRVERDVRQQWAQTSLRRFTMRHTARLLRDGRADARLERRQSFDGTPIVASTFDLGGETWTIILSDESAKVNLKLLASERPAARVRSFVAELSGTRLADTMAGLPGVQDDDETRTRQRWEHWLEFEQSEINRPELIAGATQNLTLWGDGKLNLATASNAVLNELWRELFGRRVPSALLESRLQDFGEPISKVLGPLGLRESELELATRWFKTESDTHSVWIFCRSDRTVRPALFVRWGSSVRSAEHRGYEY